MSQINTEEISLTFTPSNFIEAIYWWTYLPRYPFRNSLKSLPVVFLRHEISKVVPVYGLKRKKTYFLIHYKEQDRIDFRELRGYFISERIPEALLDALEKPYNRLEYAKYLFRDSLRRLPYSLFITIVPVMYLTMLTGEFIGKGVFNHEWGRSLSGLSACNPDCLKIAADHYRQSWNGVVWTVTFILMPFPLSLIFRRMTRDLNLRKWLVFEATIIVAGIGLPLFIGKGPKMLSTLSSALSFFHDLKN